MGKGSNLLFLAVGAALGAAVGYIAASDRKEEILNDAGSFLSKVKDGLIEGYNVIKKEAEKELSGITDKENAE